MIKKHSILQLPLFLVLSGGYIIVKYAISPLLFLFRKMGMAPAAVRKLDATCNRTILPLTESADLQMHSDVLPAIAIGDAMPHIEVKYPNGKQGLLSEAVKYPALLFFVRGSWCSYSRLHLKDVIQHMGDFKDAGVQIIALSSYDDQEKWKSMGVDIPLFVDTSGAVFRAFGVKIDSWTEFAWGRVLPHESAFLFDLNGNLAACDIRKVSGIKPGQKFLGSTAWLKIIKSKTNNNY